MEALSDCHRPRRFRLCRLVCGGCYATPTAPRFFLGLGALFGFVYGTGEVGEACSDGITREGSGLSGEVCT